MNLKSFSRILLALVLVASAVALPQAQTATTSTTLSSAVTSTSATTIVVASATNVEAGGALFVDRELMDVTAVSSTTVSVRRGMSGTKAATHASGALVYVASKSQKAGVFQSDQAWGTCTRAAEPFLPQVDTNTGSVWDCPVGATAWTPINNPGGNTARSQSFDLDNGAGTTIDALLIRHPRPIYITACRIVYQGATTGTVAGGNAKVGTTVGGAEVVAATAYANTSAVGTTTAMVIVSGDVPAATPVLVRHTGVAATQAGEAVVECDYHVR